MESIFFIELHIFHKILGLFVKIFEKLLLLIRNPFIKVVY